MTISSFMPTHFLGLPPKLSADLWQSRVYAARCGIIGAVIGAFTTRLTISSC